MMLQRYMEEWKYTHISPQIYTSIHVTALHYISFPIFTSHFFWMFHHHSSKAVHFLSNKIIYDLQGKVPSAPTQSCFHSLIVLFAKQYLPISVFYLLVITLRLCSSVLRYHGTFNLSNIDSNSGIFLSLSHCVGL